MRIVLLSVCIAVLLPLSLVVAYQWLLAIISVVPRRSYQLAVQPTRAKFLILIPAHNEESVLPQTLESLRGLDYPRDLTHIIVAADRCDDNTVDIVRKKYGVTCFERLGGVPSKGATIAWAMNELRRGSVDFDAVVIIDADTEVEPSLLQAFNQGLRAGNHIQQAYNYLSNPWATPFTRLIAVTSVLRNGFYYAAKNRIGLTAMLMGTGMCLSRQVIERHGWTAFTFGENWEFSVSLVLAGEKIYFNPQARVLAKESQDFRQASRQRLRWASGRLAVATASAWSLIVRGIRERRPIFVDVAITLLAPNYSTQATLAIGAFVTTWFFSGHPLGKLLYIWSASLLGAVAGYFLLGALYTKSPLKTLSGIALVPIFLPWRMAIEILGLMGYGRKQWLHTPRTPGSWSR